MALHLITGYAGQEHITSADQGAYNMGTYGEGEFVLDRGSKFAATVVTNNQITIANGEALMQGRFIKIPVGTTESVSIDNGSSGMKRKDLIVLRYSKDAGTGIESVALAVKKGTPSSGTPSDPSITTGDITDGTDLVNEMKLYRVNIDGLNIVSLDTLFSLKVPMVEYMDEYQLPIATASRLGGVKAGANTNIASDGKISIPDGSASAKGVLKVGSGLSVSSGIVSVPDGTTSTKGILKVGSGLSVSSGTVSVPDGTTSTKGILQVGSGLSVSSGTVSVPNGTTSTKGILQVGSGLSVSSGIISVPDGSSSTKGILKVGNGLSASSGTINLKAAGTTSGSGLGGVYIQSGKGITRNSDGEISLAMSRNDISKYGSEVSVSANGTTTQIVSITDSTFVNRVINGIGWINHIRVTSTKDYICQPSQLTYNTNSLAIVVRIINLKSTAISVTPYVGVYYTYLTS